MTQINKNNNSEAQRNLLTTQIIEHTHKCSDQFVVMLLVMSPSWVFL